jgi:hypothetical protein
VVADIAALAPARAEDGVAIAALAALPALEIVARRRIGGVDGAPLRRLPRDAETLRPTRRIFEDVALLELCELRDQPGW